MRSRGSAAALLVAAFIVGVLAGAGGILLAERGPDGPGSGRGRGGYLERLTNELELTSVQRDSVRAILDRRKPAFDSLRREMEPRFETLQQAIRSEIRLQLTPDQQRTFLDMTRRTDSIRSNRGGANRAPR